MPRPRENRFGIWCPRNWNERCINRTQLERLEAGLEYCYDDPEVNARKERDMAWDSVYNSIDPLDYDAQRACLEEHLGSIGEKVWIGRTFSCDNGKNIHIGSNVVVAAGAVVTRDIPDNTLAAGVPARAVRALDNDLEECP